MPVFALAGTFASLRQFDRAIQTYEEILGRFAANPALVERASEGLAVSHLGAGNPAGAIQTFRRLGMSEENARAKVEKLKQRICPQTKLARSASEVWRGVWDEFRNWLLTAA